MQPAQLVEYFIPEEIRHQSINEYFRGRILVISSVVAFIALSGFTVSRGMLQGFLTFPTIVLAACTFVTITTPFVFRVTHSVVIAGAYLTFCATLALVVFSFIDGGFYSTALLWFPVLPLFGVFFAGVRYGIAITTILFCDLAFLVYAHYHGMVPPNIFAGTDVILYLYFSSIVAVISIMIILAALYLSWQKAVQESLLEANRAKNDFLSGMSHELRTPLNSIMGFSEVLDREYAGELNEKQKDYVSYISASGSHMLALVNDLLDSAKIESGDMAFTAAPVNVGQLIASSLQMFQSEAEEKGVELVYEVDAHLKSLTVLLDELKFKQVLINLLSNAMHFSPQGGKIRLSGRANAHLLCVSVTDDGPGIPDEFRERIFERFYQIESDLLSSGSGLGLSISRYFVQLHNGQIFVDKTDDHCGSCFTVEIPLRLPIEGAP